MNIRPVISVFQPQISFSLITLVTGLTSSLFCYIRGFLSFPVSRKVHYFPTRYVDLESSKGSRSVLNLTHPQTRKLSRWKNFSSLIKWRGYLEISLFYVLFGVSLTRYSVQIRYPPGHYPLKGGLRLNGPTSFTFTSLYIHLFFLSTVTVVSR